MSDAEKLKRKGNPTTSSHRLRDVFFNYVIWGLLPFIAVVLAFLYLEMSEFDKHIEFEIVSTRFVTSAAVVTLIQQTNAAATEFHLATTSPAAITPTPRP